jgi:benzoyl-CoA reductase/2-hydroxyglutaryl-CoA dehydratase subunit BcrC/BadD/HgdB
MSTTVESKSNRLTMTARGGELVGAYWDQLFTAKERGSKVVWYNGHALNPLFQAAGLSWCHGEAFSARLAAQHLEGPAQAAGEEYGYVNELCSYSRTHLGCAVLSSGSEGGQSGIVGSQEQREIASRLPAPDFFVNAYQGCSTGQQWDQMSYRILGKDVPFFTVSLPYMFGSKPDAGYLTGEEWETTTAYVVEQLKSLIEFLEVQTGRPFDYAKLSEIMGYIKVAAQLRRDALAMCMARPAPATYWDWIASIAQINFMPAEARLIDYFQGVKDEVEQRLATGVTGIANERYRLYFDGIMMWNKLGWFARKFADADVAVICGRYTHQAFWQEPGLIDTSDPLKGMAQHYLMCSNSQGFKTLKHHLKQDCEDYGIDAVLFHASRTCRAYTNHQHLLARVAENDLGLPTAFFEGDIADSSFYKDEILNMRLEALLETIDAGRARRS